MIDFKCFEDLVGEEVNVLKKHFELKEVKCELIERISGLPSYECKCKFVSSELFISFQPYSINGESINLVTVSFDKGFRTMFVYVHARQIKGLDFDENSFKFPPDNMNLKEGVRTVMRRNLDHVVKHMGDIVRGGSWPQGLGLNLNDFL